MKTFKSILLVFAMMPLTLPGVAATTKMVEGTVMNTGSNNLFIVASSGEHLEITIPASTHVMRDGREVKLEQLQARDQVSVATSAGGGEQLVATDVFARSPY